MTLVGLRWIKTRAADIHLLPEFTSPQLFRLLVANVQDANGTITEVPAFTVDNVKFEFAEEPLKGLGQANGAPMDPVRGTVAVAFQNNLAGHSFVIKATATADGASAETRIRIHVHNAIKRMWLTPKRLTVRNGAKDVRFSVLAQFDDDTIGDITNWSPFTTPNGDTDFTYVHRTGANAPAPTWSSATGPVKADPQTGVLTASASTGGNAVTVQLGTTTATARAECAEPWKTQRVVDLVAGPGTKSSNFVYNILFLPDGFTKDDKTTYEQRVALIVKRLEVRGRSSPFGLMPGKVNYWRGWLASPDAGITVPTELDRTITVNGVTRGEPVPLPRIFDPAAASWDLPDLISAVGLPNPHDAEGNNLGARVATWRSIYGTAVTAALAAPAFPAWFELRDRVLLNERDTAFHMAFGTRPSLDVTEDEHTPVVNPYRLADEDLNGFLDGFVDKKNRALGTLWTTGKDKDLVVIVCRSSRDGGVNGSRRVSKTEFGRTIGVTMAERPFHQLEANPQNDGFDLVPDTIPTDVFYSLWLNTAHELGHSFGLGDEYGSIVAPPTKVELSDAAARPNIAPRDVVAPGGVIDVTKIKWAGWQRIAKAGATLGTTGPDSGPYTVALVGAQKIGFRKGDAVRLRRRPLGTAGAPSSLCTIDSLPDADHVVISPQPGQTSFKAGDFPSGSILFAPVLDKDGAELFLADKKIVLKRLTDTNNPLNALPGEAKGRDCDNKTELPVPTAARNFPGGVAPTLPTFSSWNIGLFENGGRHNCGIYRPTGVCLMVKNAQEDVNGKPVNFNDLCIVCRYAMVDTADPTLHAQVDAEYRARYLRPQS